MEEDKRVFGFLLGCGVAFIGILGAGFLFGWLPQKRGAERASNERNASISLKTLSSAEADFRANDRDGNGVQDFWTGDVAGLYRWGLIERGVAEADTRPLNPLVPNPIPFRGYYYEVLRLDNSVTPPEAYGQDTDKKSGKVHNVNRFGFVAYPANPAGTYFLMINENNSVFRAAATIARPTDWFTDNERRSYWSMPQ
jgi:type II secretory pathway pseudopilin PulG